MKAGKLRKCMGVTQNYHVSHVMNLKVIRAMILEQSETTVNVDTERKIKRKRKAEMW